jgi:hypothetical protein
MTRILLFSSFALGAALVALSPNSSAARDAPPTVEELKRVVERKERELQVAQIALAVARTRLALAEGKKELAAAEARTLIRYYEKRLKFVQDQIAKGRICNEEPLIQAEGALAVARAWLAEAEGKRAELLAELPRVIAYEEWRIKRYHSLLELKAISEETAEEGSKQPKQDLQWARERLAELRGEPAKKGEANNDGKP